MLTLTRRQALSLLSAPWAAKAAGLDIPRFRESRRAYRADATILLLSLPIYSRAGVGSAYAGLKEKGSGTRRELSLEFAGGSWPERAKGLNRLGFFREELLEGHGRLQQARYFGFMTASKEESLEEGRKALEKQPAGSVPYSAIEGVSEPGRFRGRLVRFHSPASHSWSNWSALLVQARGAFATPAATEQSAHGSWPGGMAPPPFLYTLLKAMRAHQPRMEQVFLYSSQRRKLCTERRRDERMGRRFVERNLPCDPARVIRLEGRIENLATGSQTRFRLWFEEGAEDPLPLRIEYQPKSFLRLVFEADPRVEAPGSRQQDIVSELRPSAGESF